VEALFAELKNQIGLRRLRLRRLSLFASSSSSRQLPRTSSDWSVPQPRTAATAEANNLVPATQELSRAVVLTSRLFRVTLFQQPRC